MKTLYKFIYFEKTIIRRKNEDETILWEDHPVWNCRNRRSGDVLGQIFWHRPWRQYTIHPTPDAVFNSTCLDDISHFLEQLKNAHPAPAAGEIGE